MANKPPKKIKLTSVLVSSFFRVFDSMFWSRRPTPQSISCFPPASVVVTKAFVVGTAISLLPLLHTHMLPLTCTIIESATPLWDGGGGRRGRNKEEEELELNPLTYLERRERRGLMNNTLSEKRSIFVLPQLRLHTHTSISSCPKEWISVLLIFFNCLQ